MSATPRQKVAWITAILVVVLYALLPVAWILSLSLKPTASIADGKFFPSSISFDNYKTLFQTSDFNHALVNSLGIAAISTLIAVVLASMAAYALARLDFAGKALILSGSLGVAMSPPISIVGSLFNLWRNIGLFDTWPGLIIPYMTFTLPLAIYTLSAFFREIPWELEKAAKVDGATPFQAFTKVIAPLAAPGMFTTAILVFIFCWNDFLFAISLTSTTRARTAPAAMGFFTGSSQVTSPTGSIARAAVILTLPIFHFVVF